MDIGHLPSVRRLEGQTTPNVKYRKVAESVPLKTSASKFASADKDFFEGLNGSRAAEVVQDMGKLVAKM